MPSVDVVYLGACCVCGALLQRDVDPLAGSKTDRRWPCTWLDDLGRFSRHFHLSRSYVHPRTCSRFPCMRAVYSWPLDIRRRVMAFDGDARAPEFAALILAAHKLESAANAKLYGRLNRDQKGRFNEGRHRDHVR